MKTIRALALLSLLATPAYAQDALVVPTCGTVPAAQYSVGAASKPTVDVNGKLCLSGGGGGGGSPGGSNTQVQYNQAGSFGGITGATTDGITLTLVGAALGTPVSGNLANTTGLPLSGVTGLGTGVATALSNTAGGAGGFALVGSTPPTGAAGGELAGTYPNPTLVNSAVIGKVLTGYASGAGTVAATDTILQAIQKLNGNAVAGPVGTAGGALAGTYPNPTLAAVNSIGTSLAIGGCSIGTDALCVTGTATISGATSLGNVNVTAATVPSNGLYLAGANTPAFSSAGVLAFSINSSQVVNSNNAAGWRLSSGATSATSPVFIPNRADTTTGIGAQAAGNVSIVVGGAENTRFSTSLVAVTGAVTVSSSALFATSSVAVTTGGNVVISNGSQFGFASGSSVTGASSSDTIISRGGAAATLQLGATNVDLNSSIVAQTLRTQGALTGGTSNQAGKDFTILVSPGKGTGAGGSFIVQTAPAGGSNSTPNAGVAALVADATGAVKISKGFTVATLPTAGTAGRYAYVTDQLTTCAAAGAAIVGGGAVVCPVFDNGVAWVGG